MMLEYVKKKYTILQVLLKGKVHVLKYRVTVWNTMFNYKYKYITSITYTFKSDRT